MDRLAERPEVATLIPEIDLDARVVYFPVRHHSPACAWHVRRLIRDLRPKHVLIEGPRDATPLIPFLTHERTRMPVAIYTTYVQRRGDELPARHAAYYPLCDYSPELAAIRAAAETGAEARFIDLTYPEMVRAEQTRQDEHARSLFEERYLRHSRLLQAACSRCGVRDPDDLWDHCYEVSFAELDNREFMRNVLAYCALARRDYTEEMLKAEGCLAREAAMAAAVAATDGKTLVVTGGFHSVALPTTAPALPEPVAVAPADAQVVLMRYGFEQLDRLNGYASGIPSPEFYQRVWEGSNPAKIIVELGRECRERQPGSVSAADQIAALTQARLLARFRGHRRLSREDLLDGIRSVFIKGAEDIEGTVVLALARKLLAGERVGDVPPEAGQPPLVNDFRRTAAELKIDSERLDAREIALDIYRKARAREISRFFHRLGFLNVPFAQWLGGPDFIQGKNLERIQETWKYHWSPNTESALIERSLYGSTLEEACTSLLLERFAEAEKQGQGRRADVAALLLLEACRMGLHRHTPDLLQRTGALIAEDSLFVSLAGCMEALLVLHVSREPLEAHDLTGLTELAATAYERACYLLPRLVNTTEEEEAQVLDALNSLVHSARTLGDAPEHRELRWQHLRGLALTTGGNAALRGAALGMLFGDGQCNAAELIQHLRGHLLSARDNGKEGPAFLRGLLRTARNVLWQLPEVVASIHEVLRQWEEQHFVRQLPTLRLAFADLTPRECDRVAQAVADHAGVAAVPLIREAHYTSIDMIQGAEVNRRVREGLRRDGLEDFGV
ncbi:MAG TPA: DUF5682 family protein [Gemmataceae bacterium]|nr:DUF5682 family protein [Gemmataceae bacterium]